jgi:hypothetical protein
MNIPPVGAELFHVWGQLSMTNLIAALRNFANAPQNVTKRKRRAEKKDEGLQ